MSERELFNLADKVTRRLLKRYAPHLSERKLFRWKLSPINAAPTPTARDGQRENMNENTLTGNLTAEAGKVYDYTEITGNLDANRVADFSKALPNLKKIGGYLDLGSLTDAKGLKLPQSIGRFLQPFRVEIPRLAATDRPEIRHQVLGDTDAAAPKLLDRVAVRHLREIRREPAGAAVLLLPAELPDVLPVDLPRLAGRELPADGSARDLRVAEVMLEAGFEDGLPLRAGVLLDEWLRCSSHVPRGHCRACRTARYGDHASS
jgi:hypothetical protein